jgi:D-3-phosphoglycerate dehydrogenase
MSQRQRVLVTEAIAGAGVALLEEGGLDVDVRTDLDHDELVQVVGQYDGLIVRSATKVRSDVIDAAGRLKVVGRAGVGVDNVDVDAATRRGILVVNAPQGNIISNAEHTMALLLALVRNIPQAHASLIAGQWDREKFMGAELHSKVLGIIGLGNVGTLVAQRGNAFGMKLLASDPYKTEQWAARIGVELVGLDELLARADVITLHVHKTADTRGMIGEAELEKCKTGVLIVNTSRGGLIDEEALVRAIKSGKVAGAAFDVFETEPASDSPLFGLAQVVVTPHLGGSTVEAQDKAGTSIAEQVLLALRGEFVPNAVNLQAGRELSDFVRPFVDLARKLGRLAAALTGEAVGELEVEYLGQIGEEDTRVLTLSALRGFLQPAVHEPVTYVNAPVLASDRGINYGERKSKATADYLNLVRVTTRRDGRTVTVAGTLAGRRNEPRLVEIDDVGIEVSLTPYMAFFRYQDRPGVVHKLTGVLAAHDINIAFMQVGRRGEGEEAIMALAVDSPIPADVFREAMAAADIASGRFVALEGGEE